MKLIIKETAQEVSEAAFSILSDVVNANPECVISYPTGGSVELLYEIMRRESAGKRFDLRRTYAFQLDDYLGVPFSHPARFANLLYRQVFVPCGIAESRIHLFGEDESFFEKEASDYEKQYMIHGGIDLQLLGVGANGHVGFNEPAEEFARTTRRVELTGQMRRDALPVFHNIESVPRYAATMGLRAINSAKKLLLLALGEKKADAIQKLVTGHPSPSCPISALKGHDNFTIIADRAAAARLPDDVPGVKKN